MKSNYKAAIIGCGNIAGKHDEEKKNVDGIFSHAGGYTRNSITIQGAADPDERRLLEFGKFWNVRKIYTDYKEMLSKEDIEIVSVCTPDKTHYSVIMDALTINPPPVIFAEKPLAETTDKVRELISVAKNTNTKIVVDYQRRWDPGHIQIRDLIQKGYIGTIQAVNASYVKGIRHIGCTAINTLRFLLDEINQVMAIPPYNLGTFPEDPTLDAILFFRNGSKAFLQGCDKQGYSYSIFEIDIIGSEGRFRLVDNGEVAITYQKKPYHSYPGFFELVETERNGTGMPFALEYAVKSVAELVSQTSDEYINSGVESLRDMIIIDCIQKSAKSGGRIVNVPEI